MDKTYQCPSFHSKVTYTTCIDSTPWLHWPTMHLLRTQEGGSTVERPTQPLRKEVAQWRGLRKHSGRR